MANIPQIKISEIFFSLQGEGLHIGTPSIFMRTFGCNFRCRGFGRIQGEPGELTDEPKLIAIQMNQNPDWKYEDLPLAKTGCDSYAAVYPEFKKLSPMMQTNDIVTKMEAVRTQAQDLTISGKGPEQEKPHLVITGGEPMLGWQRAYPSLISQARILGYHNITIETNGTQEISAIFADYLRQIKEPIKDRVSGIKNLKKINLTFSISPKLSCSGESDEDALKPEIIKSYQDIGDITYLKFVVDSDSDMSEVNDYVYAYRKVGFTGEVYLMPVGGDSNMYNFNAPEVAKLAMRYGYRYSPRLQVDLWQNRWGT